MTKLTKKIDIGKLKVKYVLGIHTSLSTYPDAEDVLYDLIRDYAGRVSTELKFTNISLQKRFNLTDEKTSDIINHLMSHNFLEIINDTTGYTTYKVIKNPYS